MAASSRTLRIIRPAPTSSSVAKATSATTKTPRKAANDHKPAQPKPRANSKQAEVIDLLRRPQGSTIPAITKVTGWQQHSVRGFFAGVVRKKLGLNLISEKTEQGRIYRIATKSATGAKSGRKAA